jgi:AsmA protein
MKRKLIKLGKWTGIILGIFMILLLISGFFLSRYFDEQVKAYANNHIKGELNYSKSRLSVFEHFPYLTLSFYDLSLKGAPPFEKDTLLTSDKIGLGIDLSSLLKGDMVVDKIYFNKGHIHVLVDEEGKANYDIYASGDTTSTQSVDEDETKLSIEQITIEDADLTYDDRSLQMLIHAKGLDYKGRGDLDASVFDLISNARIKSFDFNYDNQYYFLSKKVEADLLTSINTRSLSIAFKKNDLKINQLPVQFTGIFEFLKSGYKMDFQVKAASTNLRDMITALPQDYLTWMEHTDIKGDANMKLSLSGIYDAETETLPNLSFDLDVRNGYILHEKAPSPVKDLWLDIHASIPELNPEKTTLDLDSLSFQLDQGYFNASLHTKGIENPQIKSNIQAALDLEKLQRAVGFSNIDLKGNVTMQLKADGVFSRQQNPASKTPDTIITSIPAFQLQSSMKNGVVKTKALSAPLQQIFFDIEASCRDNNYRNASLALNNLNINYLKNYIKGKLEIRNGTVPFVNANLQSQLQLSTLKEFYLADSFDLKGNLFLDMTAKGKVDIDQEIYPDASVSAKITNGFLQTPYYPRPIENIQMNASVFTQSANLKKIKLNIQPLTFSFEEQPIFLQMRLEDFEDLRYDIIAKGKADLDHLSQVFTDDDLNISGKVRADMALKGRQSDLENQRYHLLNHSGMLELKEVETRSVHFPLPVMLHHGLFRFQNDSVRMETFDISYGKSDLKTKGAVANMIQYFLHDGELRGHVDLKSKYLNINELMASSATSNTNAGNQSTATATQTETGVVVIPPSLSIHVNAAIDKVDFNDLHIQDCHADISMHKGELNINQAGFRLIDAPVTMKASYKNVNTTKAYFDYEIDAKEFDIKRAYNEIELFREMVTSAGSAEGIVSLNYKLKGRLNSGMEPVLPSLEGGGTLSLLKIKLKGYKLFAAIGKASGKDSLNSNQNISNVDIKTTIKNNIITLDPLKMRIAGFWPRIKGQTSFDGLLNLKFRLGLPPLGIIGIPFNVTGTQTKPIVKLGRGKKNKNLSETEDEDWD